MKFRILKHNSNNIPYYTIQEKWLFWWVNLRNIDNYKLTFNYSEAAEQYIRINFEKLKDPKIFKEISI